MLRFPRLLLIGWLLAALCGGASAAEDGYPSRLVKVIVPFPPGSTLDALAGDQSLRLLVIAAAGKGFCAGHDLKEMRAVPSLRSMYRPIQYRFSAMRLSISPGPRPTAPRCPWSRRPGKS